MKGESAVPNKETVTRKELIALLNEDLAREYQAIISYVIYSQVLKGAEYMNIAGELEKHAGEELRSRFENFQFDRLSRRNAHYHAEASAHFRKSKGHVAI